MDCVNCGHSEFYHSCKPEDPGEELPSGCVKPDHESLTFCGCPTYVAPPTPPPSPMEKWQAKFEKFSKIADWLVWGIIIWALFYWLPWVAALLIAIVIVVVVVLLSLDVLLLFVRLLGRAWRGEI